MGPSRMRTFLFRIGAVVVVANLSLAQTPTTPATEAKVVSARRDTVAFNNSHSESNAEALNAAILEKSRPLPRIDVNSGTYYRHKVEFSLEGAYMPINVPFMFDFLLGGDYTMESLRYTMIPIKGTFRYQLGNVSGPKFLRGTWDATFGATYTAIPRGPESRYFGYMMGFRRNFVQRRWRAVPYLDGSVGIGNVDARAPRGVPGAQGQDLTFSIYIDSGVRYNINSRYAVSMGIGYMHISNLYLSEPRYLNYGINVVGPTIGLDYRVGKRRDRTQ